MNIASELRAFNRWRRGDDSIKQPEPKRLGEVIASAASELERLQAMEKLVKNLLSQKGRHNTEIAYLRLAERMGKSPKEST